MTDQTRWGIDLVHTKNKAIKRQKDIINRALSEVEKLEEQYIVELMMEIEAIMSVNMATIRQKILSIRFCDRL